MEYRTDDFINMLYRQAQAQENLLTCDDANLHSLTTNKKARLRKVMGLDKLSQFACKPSFRVIKEAVREGYREYLLKATILPDLQVPIHVLQPNTYTKTIVYAHGHGEGATAVVDSQFLTEYQKCLPIQLAQQGYRVIVPELVGFGRVKLENFSQDYERGCYANSTQFLLFGITMTGVRVQQILQIVEYLNQTEKTTPILAGISGGGLVTAFTAAVCENIAGAFISGYANTFKGSIMPLYHCVDNFVPDIFSVGEEPEIIALAQPTPLLLSSGTKDTIFPLEHTLAACEYIENVYRRFGVESNVTKEIFEGEHEISTSVIMDWLKKI